MRVKITQRCLVVLALAAGAATAQAQPGIRLLIPSDNTCNAFLAALDSGNRTAMLSLGGWALGYLSGIAQQSGKDILHDVASESLMDRIADTCQRQPDRAMSSVVMEIANSLLTQAK
jgi:hypothetical protein